MSPSGVGGNCGRHVISECSYDSYDVVKLCPSLHSRWFITLIISFSIALTMLFAHFVELCLNFAVSS